MQRRVELGWCGVLLFLHFGGGGAFLVPLYALDRPPALGGVGLDTDTMTTLGVVVAAASLIALGGVRKLERTALPPRAALPALMLANAFGAAALGALILGADALDPGHLRAALYATAAAFATVNGVQGAVLVGRVVLPTMRHHGCAHHFGRLRILGTLGWLCAGLSLGWLQPAMANLLGAAGFVAGALTCLAWPTAPASDTREEDAPPITGSSVRAILGRSLQILLILFLTACVARFYEVDALRCLKELHRAGALRLGRPEVPLVCLSLAGEVVLLWYMGRWSRSDRVLCALIPLAAAGWTLLYFGLCAMVVSQSPAFLALLVCQGANCGAGTAASLLVDRRTEGPLRGTAQSLLLVATGLGGVAGSCLNGALVAWQRDPSGHARWAGLWLTAGLLAATLLVYAVSLHRRGLMTDPGPHTGPK